MTASLFLQSVADRIEDMVEQVQDLSKTLTDAQLNWKPHPKRWSVGQTLDHMLIAADPYVSQIKEALGKVHRVSGDPEVLHTFFGKLIIRGAGPSGNAPVPKAMVPSARAFDRGMIDRWVALHQEIIALARQAHGIDLASVPMRSPIVKLFKMNLADVFEILAAHAERHVGQIEALCRELPKPADPPREEVPTR
ncbi:MAG TPA: DinB family protein [Fimbriimonadaceae bacterium]|nr:DinB family protein [Fimbriimonadaceae bacterium]